MTINIKTVVMIIINSQRGKKIIISATDIWIALVNCVEKNKMKTLSVVNFILDKQ